jgi:hypothetical protein
MTLKAAKGLHRPQWWQIHPTLAFCSAWAVIVAGGAATAVALLA